MHLKPKAAITPAIAPQGATTTPRIPTVTGTFNSTSPSEFFITIFETLPFFTISLMDSTTLFAPEEVPVLLLSIFSSMLIIAPTTTAVQPLPR